MTPFSVHIITLVPDIWPVILGSASGLVGRAFADEKVSLTVHDLRTHGKGVHRQVDDTPYGGGAGMVLGVEPLVKAIAVAKEASPDLPVYLLSPRARPFVQSEAQNLAQGQGFTLICGRYEGVDERVWDYVDGEISLGDFVLSAGDPAAWAVVDSVVRLLPGVLGNAESISEESYAQGLVEYPHYTRPAVFEEKEVPAVLRSGDHGAIARWRHEQSERITKEIRPDLLDLSERSD